MTSPGWITPLSAGPPWTMPATSAPRALSMPRLSAISSVTGWMRTPSQPRRVSPNSTSWSITVVASAEGMAKPMPIDPPVGEMIAVLIPITPPVHVEERSAGITPVDRRIRLDEIVIGTGAKCRARAPRRCRSTPIRQVRRGCRSP